MVENIRSGFSAGKMKTAIHKPDWNRWWLVVTYAAAMAWVESAVVFYLRSMMHRIEPYQAYPLPVIGGFASAELPREFATLVMLFAVGALAGRTWRARLGYSAIAFGAWDIFYYVFLKIICGWPHSLLDWDVLFLLPLPWWGPVLAPVLISLLLICWGTLASQFESVRSVLAPGRYVWLLSVAGATLALYVFMADELAASPRGMDAIRTILPVTFDWPLFSLALMLISAPVVATGWEIWSQRNASIAAQTAEESNHSQFSA